MEEKAGESNQRTDEVVNETSESDNYGKDATTFQIMPSLEDRFKSSVVKELIQNVLEEHLGGKTYEDGEAKQWTQNIANDLKNRVTDLGFKRYKYSVQVVLGEQHGAGVKICSRCLWDADADNYASNMFMNDTIFCMAVVFAIFFY